MTFDNGSLLDPPHERTLRVREGEEIEVLRPGVEEFARIYPTQGNQMPNRSQIGFENHKIVLHCSWISDFKFRVKP